MDSSARLFLLLLLVCHSLGSVAQSGLVTLTGYAQGTTYQVKYADKNARNFGKAVDSLLVDFDKALSTYRPDSELSLFNLSHAIRFQSPYFYPVLKKSEEVYQATEGLFDPTVMPLVEAYGFGPKGRKGATGFDLDSVMQLVGFRQVSFDSVSVRKSKEGVRLDFNAIAQGYSVDVICDFLHSMGVADYLVEVGGELRGSGTKPDGSAWVVGISDPLKPSELLATVKIENRAMATSGNYRNHYEKDGVVYTHIINPISGKPGVSDILSVTVFADDAMTADAFATACLLMGIDRLKEKLPDLPELDVFACYSTSEGRPGIYVSERLKPFVSMNSR